MKKIAMACAFLFALSSLAAQPGVDATGFRFGLQASPTFSWMRTSDKKIEGTGINLGLKLAVQGEAFFAPNYALFTGIGLGFNQGGTLQNGYARGVFWKNSELTDVALKDLPQNGKLHYRLNYVEIPLGLKLLAGQGKVRYYAEAPVFTLGFVTRALGDIRGTNNTSEDENIREDVNGLSLSWGLGGGIEYEVGSVNLVAGISYQQQFTDATKDDGRVYNTLNLTDEGKKESSKGTLGLIALRLGVIF